MAAQMKCVIVSGAPESSIDYYHKYINNSYIICADSGYVKCNRLGITPDLIVGDFDSSDLPDCNCEIVRLDVRKDDTDTFHCVKLAISKGFDDIVILGGIGSRVDHTYSNILCVNYCKDNSIRCALVNDKNYITVESGTVRIKKSEFKYFSLFALFGKCEGVTIRGAEYSLNNFELYPFYQTTQSNEFKNDVVNIEIKKGKILLIQSND